MATWNAHRREWDGALPEHDGPIELYRPVADGTEDLPVDAEVEVEYHGDYESFTAAADAIDCTGRWLWSTPDRGKYLGYLNSLPGSVRVASF